METVKNKIITVETTVLAPMKKVWSYWTEPCHITKWCFASDDWQAPYAENDLKVSGKFKTKMASKDGSAGFDFEGVYTRVIRHKAIEYRIPDGRKVVISF
ncbi:MAG TPA: SRPBCC domain-containing protein, partial [Bacteroidales bacterium]